MLFLKSVKKIELMMQKKLGLNNEMMINFVIDNDFKQMNWWCKIMEDEQNEMMIPPC